MVVVEQKGDKKIVSRYAVEINNKRSQFHWMDGWKMIWDLGY